MDALSLRFIFFISQIWSLRCQDTHALLLDLRRTCFGRASGRPVYFTHCMSHLDYGVLSKEAHLAWSFGGIFSESHVRYLLLYHVTTNYQIIHPTHIAVETETFGPTT
jgi:hypothetical protein